jgi:hypothetical protein
MRYQLIDHGWPIGGIVIPPGTIIDLGQPWSRKPDDKLTQWEKLAKDKAPPLNALALDPECIEMMKLHYYYHPHLLKSDLTQWESDVRWNAAVKEVLAERAKAEAEAKAKKEK